MRRSSSRCNTLAVTGQTQAAGKTTTIEALVARSGRRAIAFVTKRHEGSFRGDHHRVAPYFRERADWQFVQAILEATMRERMRFERAWIMRASKGAKTLADVRRNVQRLMDRSKGLSADVYMQLDAYLEIVVPQIDRLPYTSTLSLARGLNVMDVSPYTTEMQSLVIRSVIEWIYEHGRDTLVVIPESWEFVPQARGSPVLLAAEQLIRKGGAGGNFVWLDSQDIAGVHKNVLRSVGVWILRRATRTTRSAPRACAHPRQEAFRRRRDAIGTRAVLLLPRPHRREGFRATDLDVGIACASYRTWQSGVADCARTYVASAVARDTDVAHARADAIANDHRHRRRHRQRQRLRRRPRLRRPRRRRQRLRPRREGRKPP